jgi:hypothetical protein
MVGLFPGADRVVVAEQLIERGLDLLRRGLLSC